MATGDGQGTMMAAQALQAFRAEVISNRNLPTIPAVLAKIVQLADSEGANSRELVEVVEHDQTLTSKILRLANSAFFGQARRVATIPRAVVLLGFSTVRNLALGVKVWDSLGGGLATQRLEALWAHGVMVAMAGKWLTARLRAGDPDEAFTAGLLHDIGRLVMATKLGGLYWEALAAAAPEQAIDALESATFGVDHAEVGGWLLEAWGLPQGIVEAVRHHHAVRQHDAAAERPGVAGALAIANRLVGWTDLATETCRPEAASLFAAYAERGVTPEAWAAVVTGMKGDGLLALKG